MFFVIEGKAAGYRRCEYAAMYRKKALPRAYRWGKGRADGYDYFWMETVWSSSPEGRYPVKVRAASEASMTR